MLNNWDHAAGILAALGSIAGFVHYINTDLSQVVLWAVPALVWCCLVIGKQWNH